MEEIYEARINVNLKTKPFAIVVLPDIYGQSDYAKQTVEEMAKNFGIASYMFDYFYELTGEITDIDQTDSDKARDLMQQYSGDMFLQSFAKCKLKLLELQPSVTTIIVIGFCFAGRLAYLSGSDAMVKTIVSFYGAGANLEGFVAGKTAIDYLLSVRGSDSELRVLSFFGNKDDSIPESDRQMIAEKLGESSINYEAHEYDCGHAYFQPGRANYDESAAKQSWKILKEII